jgi:ketosteroid isomerase-like protein
MSDTPAPRAVAEAFFDRMADDRRRTAGELFVADPTITLPGASFAGEDAFMEFLDHLAPRYERATKSLDRWIESGSTVVSIGTLSGVDNRGEAFEGVRYIDIYEVADDRIERLDIWNDLLVAGVVDS